MNIKELISSIEYNNGVFPEKEIKQLIESKEAAIPELLSVLEYTRDNIDWILSNNTYNACIFATYLLAQFREYKAYKLLFEILRNLGESADDLYGDAITEDMGRILASVCNNDISLIKQLIEDSSIDEHVRSSAINALVLLVVRNELKRDEIIVYFRSLYEYKLEREYSFVWDALVLNTYNLHPKELMSEIKKVYEEDLVDEYCVSFDNIVEQIKIKKEIVLKKLEKDKHFTFIEDTINEFRYWACFNKSNTPGLQNENFIIEKSEGNTYQPKIGRNDLCPCGSGKKYKKCCIE
jgi:hypothetical protein